MSMNKHKDSIYLTDDKTVGFYETILPTIDVYSYPSSVDRDIEKCL
jgi:hypothetical protein